MMKTPAEEAGLHTGDVIKIITAEGDTPFTKGRMYILQNDDGSKCPWFIDYNGTQFRGRKCAYIEKNKNLDWEIVRKSVPIMTDEEIKSLVLNQYFEDLNAQLEYWKTNGSEEQLKSVIASLLLVYRELYK